MGNRSSHQEEYYEDQYETQEQYDPPEETEDRPRRKRSIFSRSRDRQEEEAYPDEEMHADAAVHEESAVEAPQRRKTRRLFGRNHSFEEEQLPVQDQHEAGYGNIPAQEGIQVERKRSRKLFGGGDRVRWGNDTAYADPGEQTRGGVYQEAALPPPPPTKLITYLEHLSTRPHLLVHRPAPPASSLHPTSTDPPPLESFTMPLPIDPSYTPRRKFHPPQTVRIPKAGTWVLKNIRSGGQGVKRGQLEDLKDGVRQVKEMRKQAREAERQRRYDDACREYAALKVVTEQDTRRGMKQSNRSPSREARRAEKEARKAQRDAERQAYDDAVTEHENQTRYANPNTARRVGFRRKHGMSHEDSERSY